MIGKFKWYVPMVFWIGGFVALHNTIVTNSILSGIGAGRLNII